MLPDLTLVCLLLTPLDPAQEQKFPDTVSPILYAQMKQSADILELSGPGDFWRRSFKDEILWCRFTFKHSGELPFLCSAKCCPLSMKIIEDCLDFNRERRNWLLWDRVYHPENVEHTDKQIEDVDERYAKWLIVWRQRREADEKSNIMMNRRAALRELLLMSNDLPCPVDVGNYKKK